MLGRKRSQQNAKLPLTSRVSIIVSWLTANSNEFASTLFARSPVVPQTAIVAVISTKRSAGNGLRSSCKPSCRLKRHSSAVSEEGSEGKEEDDDGSEAENWVDEAYE